MRDPGDDPAPTGAAPQAVEATAERDAVARSALEGRRLGVVSWLVLWAGITVPQLAALWWAWEAGWGPFVEPQPAAAVPWGLAALGLQGVKAGITLPRLRDLGRPADDVIWALTPVLNVALFFQLLQRTPREPLRLRRARAWCTQTGALQAYGRAAPRLVGTAMVGLPLVVLGAAVSGPLSGWFVEGWFAWVAEAGSEGLVEGLAVTVGALGAYTLIQFLRRSRVGLASWIPSLLLLPCALLAAAVTFRDTASQGAGALLLILVELAWFLGPVGLVSGLVAGLWIAAGHLVSHGESAGPGAVWSLARPRLGAVAAVWAWRNQVVQLGAQVIVPGVWFGVSYAFADLVAFSHAEERPLAGSSERAAGARGRVFKLLVLWFVVGGAWQASALFVLVGPVGAFESLFDPTRLSPGVTFVEQLGWWLAAWWSLLATQIVFAERDALLLQRRARPAAAVGPGASRPHAAS